MLDRLNYTDFFKIGKEQSPRLWKMLETSIPAIKATVSLEHAIKLAQNGNADCYDELDKLSDILECIIAYEKTETVTFYKKYFFMEKLRHLCYKIYSKRAYKAPWEE